MRSELNLPYNKDNRDIYKFFKLFLSLVFYDNIILKQSCVKSRLLINEVHKMYFY